jgi:two-component system, OmpR family, alkaline phosphatase synthesis response regulator PhoP
MDYRGKRILIVDDEEDLCEILQYNLDNEGFITDVAHSAEEALKKSLPDFDLLLLDVMMGPMSGFKLADKLRKELDSNIPVIFLTAKDTENDLLTGFSLGADDYISKPFSINELTARIKAVLKRSPAAIEQMKNVIKSGNIELDQERKRMVIEGELINLTKKEFEIINLLIRNPGKLYSRENILDLIWTRDVIVTSRTVDVNIARIRTKLGKYGANLKNKTGYGYYFENI